MRSFQLRLHHLWDQEDDSTLIPWDPACRQDLEWWLVLSRLQAGISLAQVNPLDFWSDASDVGLGAHLLGATASSLWSREESLLSINARELLAVEYSLCHFHLLVANSTVAVFLDNSTGVAYLRKQGGTQLHFSEDPPLGGDDQLSPVPSIHPGQEQCSSGLPVSSKTGPGV